MLNRDYSHVDSFDKMGKLLYSDPNQGLYVYAGNIFECPTVKGNTNLIVVYRVMDGHIYYGHGDKLRKTPLEHFVRAVLSGDIQPRKAKEIDTERLEMCQIALDAIAERMTGEEVIDYRGDRAEEMFMRTA